MKFGELLHRHWVLTTSLAWVWFLVFIQRKRRRSLTVGNGSGVSVCPPMVTVAWGHVRALELELSANKPPRLRSVRFPATGKSNLEVRGTYISSSSELEHIRHQKAASSERSHSFAESPYSLLIVNSVFHQLAEICSPVVNNPI